jgi:hypothetical protein
LCAAFVDSNSDVGIDDEPPEFDPSNEEYNESVDGYSDIMDEST